MTTKTTDQKARDKNHCVECGVMLTLDSDEMKTGLCNKHLIKFRQGGNK